jgi:hypothetical protein
MIDNSNKTFYFTDENGQLLKSSDRQQLIGDLNNGIEITINVNVVDFNLPTITPVIYLQPSTDYGEVDYPGLQSPYSDYQDLLLWGSNTDNIAGLYIKAPPLNETENADISQRDKTYFSYSKGSKLGNGIELLNLKNVSTPGIYSYKLGFTNNSSSETRRFYIGLQIEDRGF